MEIYSRRRSYASGIKNTLKSIETVTPFRLEKVEPMRSRVFAKISTDKQERKREQSQQEEAAEKWYSLIQARWNSLRDTLMIKFFDELK